VYQSILNFKRARYLWLALVVSVMSIAAYQWHQPIGMPNGGTWLGYTLGTIGALLIVWLLLLGMRKRSYNSNMGTVQGWTSAHVYLGTALLLIGTLHGGFQFGMNVHTLTYVLMVVVILSGFFGIFVYLKYPNLLTVNRSGDTLDSLLDKVLKIDERSRRIAATPDLSRLVDSAIDGCEIGGGWWQQLTAKGSSTISIPNAFDLDGQEKPQSNKDQALVIDVLANRLSQLSGGGDEAGAVQGLIANFAAKQTLLRRIKRDVQIRAILKIWLYIHVPISFALLAALMTHVIVVFFYW
jgi:hypothetical protein